ncbi:hypothetical protein Tco_1012329 [Tanacetum coccineum]
MKEKGDPFILVGYSTYSKGYRVYNKRTRLIVESIHINFVEIKELSQASDYDNYGPVPQLQMTSDHNSSEFRTCDHSNEPSSSKLIPTFLLQSPNVSPSAEIDAPSLQELDLLFCPLYDEFFTARNQYHPLEQVHRNPSKPVQTRRQLDTDPEMCMFALTEELHQFNTLKVWELVDIPFGRTVIKLKWLWKNKKDEDNDVIHNKAHLAKYALEILKKHGMDKCDSIGTTMATKPKLNADFSGLLTPTTQDCIAMSTEEAEYVELFVSCAQVIWMRIQLKDYGFDYNKIPLYCDSQSAIGISCNSVQHSHTKHVNVCYHFIKEQVGRGIIELYFVKTEYQLANIFMKALSQDWFEYLVR